MRQIVSAGRLPDFVGREIGCSRWMKIDQRRIDAFAEVTEDRQFIHLDEQRARQTPFGGTIAHGFLTLSLLTRLTEDIGVVPEGMTMGINYGFDKVRFLQPVRCGSEIRARSTLLEVTEKNPGQFLMKTAVTIEIRGEDNPALFAEWLALVIATGDRNSEE